MEEREVCGDFSMLTTQGAKLLLQHHPGWLTSQPSLCGMEAQLTHLELLTAQLRYWRGRKKKSMGMDKIGIVA